MKAWHFVGDTLRDGRPVPADGEKLVHPGRPVICESGLHASLRPWDALQHAPGGTLCLVECDGEIVHGNDKLVCTERTILVRMDATPLLRYCARQQALSVIHLWEPDQVVLEYLMGDDAAWSAAAAAAWSSSWSSWSAAAAAAASWSAASWSAAAASSAAESAWLAARAAASSAAAESACAMFDELVYETFADWL